MLAGSPGILDMRAVPWECLYPAKGWQPGVTSDLAETDGRGRQLRPAHSPYLPGWAGPWKVTTGSAASMRRLNGILQKNTRFFPVLLANTSVALSNPVKASHTKQGWGGERALLLE